MLISGIISVYNLVSSDKRMVLFIGLVFYVCTILPPTKVSNITLIGNHPPALKQRLVIQGFKTLVVSIEKWSVPEDGSHSLKPVV